MTEEQNKQLALRNQAEVPSHLQTYMQGAGEGRPEGLEAYSLQDIEIPRIILMQALSPEVEKENKYRSGDLVHSVNDDLLCDTGEPVRIIPIRHFHQFIAWKPRSIGGGIIATDTNPKGWLARLAESGAKLIDIAHIMGPDNQPIVIQEEAVKIAGSKEAGDGGRLVTAYHNFIVFAPAYGQMPMMLCCGKTNYKHGRNLLSRIVMRGPKMPCFAGAYTMKSDTETNTRGQTFKVFNFAADGWATPEEFEFARELSATFKDRTVKTNLANEEVGGNETVEEDEI